MRVFADFDGTIAVPDVTDLMLARFADPAWEQLEAEWIAGAIDAATCMRAQIALLHGARADFDAVLDTVAIDPDFPTFAHWCANTGVQLAVVSDGVDYFIHRILTRYGLDHIPVFANALRTADGAHSLQQPWLIEACAAQQGVCKCAVTRANADAVVFVGDGRSDECVSQIADFVFAKGKLATFCINTNRDFIAFDTFADVQAGVSRLLDRTSAAPVIAAD